MALVIRKAFEYLKYWNNEYNDPRVRDFPLMESPIELVCILFVYWLFVTKIGPKLMEHREPFKLDQILRIYNVIQVILNAWMFVFGILTGYIWNFNWVCESVDRSVNPLTTKLLKFCYLYFLVKLLDLMDTVFFVLRKKMNQVTFLHVYHHICKLTLMLIKKNFLRNVPLFPKQWPFIHGLV